MSETDAYSTESTSSIEEYQLWVERPFTLLQGTTSDDWIVRWGPYLVVGSLLGAFVLVPPILELILSGVFPIFEAPALLLIPPIYIAIIWVSRVLRDQYYQDTVARLRAIRASDREPVKAFIRNRYPDAVQQIQDGRRPDIPGATQDVETHLKRLWEEEDDDPSVRHPWLTRLGLVPPPTAEELYGDIVPRWLRFSVVLGGLGMHALWFLVDPNPMRSLLVTYGPTVANLFFKGLVPLVMLPIAADLVSIFIGITILLPVKVVAADRVDFGDPAQFAGLRPVGTLIRNGGFAIALFLVVWVALEAVAPTSSPFDPFSIIVFGAGGALAIGLFFVPVLYLHRFMHAKKHEKIREITSLLVASGPQEEGQVFPETMIGHYDVYDQETYHEYTHLHIHLTRVENTKEYPVDAGIVAEFLFVLAIPFFAHVAWTFIFNTMVH